MTVPIAAGANVSIALLHYPVYDRQHRVVTSAVTNLDIHDIARAAKTFGLGRYYVVTPVPEQQELTDRICRHWLEGWGATYNPARRAALELLRVRNDLESVVEELTGEFGRAPKVVVTGARGREGAIGCAELAQLIAEREQPYLLLFGTGWGLADELFARADYILKPIGGPGSYNHLSVRSAVSIMLDRLFGER